jgi:hypothetical protein
MTPLPLLRINRKWMGGSFTGVPAPESPPAHQHAHGDEGLEAAVSVFLVDAVEKLQQAAPDVPGDAAHHAKVVAAQGGCVWGGCQKGSAGVGAGEAPVRARGRGARAGGARSGRGCAAAGTLTR